MLTGLDTSYDALVTSINLLLANGVSLDDLYSHMLDYEARQENANAGYQLSANLARRGNGARGGSGGGSSSGGGSRNRNNDGGSNHKGNRRNGNGGGCNGNNGNGNSGNNGSLAGGQQGGYNRRNFNSDRPRVPCQICNKLGHSARSCYDRLNQNFKPEDARFANNINTGSPATDPTWYVDSGATDHITSDLDKLHMREQYTGKDQVHAANGTGMDITHVGKALLPTPHASLALKNVLCVPHTTKNLLSTHRLTIDNNVCVENHPHYFLIKDRASKKVLLRGPSDGGLYPVHHHQSIRNKTVFSAVTKPSHDRWHCRLGHPSSRIVDHVLGHFNLRSLVGQIRNMCVMHVIKGRVINLLMLVHLGLLHFL